MHIAGLEAIPIAIPFRDPYVTASGRLLRREMLLVRVHTTDGGPTGLGETLAMTLRGGRGTAEIIAALDGPCAAALTGRNARGLAGEDGVDPRRAIWELVERCRAGGAPTEALNGVDLALHDLAGRLTGLPVWRVLGAAQVAPVPCNATLVADDPERVATRAAERARRGFRTFKLKVGAGADLQEVAAVREALGPDARIRVDANGAWSATEAIEALRAMAPHGLELAEQPAPELSDLAAVRAAVEVPVSADESLATVADAERAFDLRACDLAAIKLVKAGGLIAALQVATVLPAYLSSALDGPVGIAAAAHLAQALPRGGFAGPLAHGLATEELFAERIAVRGPTMEGAGLLPPRAPGLGVELDEDAVRRLRV